MEAVRATGDNALLFAAHFLERLNVVHRHFIEEVLIARTAGGIAGACFHVAQHGEIDAGRVQDGHRGARHFLSLGVIRPGATDPVEHLKVRIFFHCGHIERQRAGPGQAVVGLAPGVARAFHAAVSALQLTGEISLHQHLVTADVQDVEHRLVTHRANLDTGATGSAGPEGALADGIVQQVRFVDAASRQVRHILTNVVALVNLQRRGRKLLAGDVSRAGILAAVAHDAGKGIEYMRLLQVGEACHAKLFDALIFKVNGIQGAQGGALRSGHEVEWSHEEMGMFGIGEIGQEKENEAQGDPPAGV